MVEIIGLVAMGALIWVLAWAMGAEKSDAERKTGYAIRDSLIAGNDRERAIRHAA